MAKIKKVDDGEYLFVCDCGQFVHTLSTGADGKLKIETQQIKPTEQPKPEEQENGKEKGRAQHAKAGFFEDLGI